MISIPITATTSITTFINAYWSNDRIRVAQERAEVHYRNRIRWQNVMPAVVKALPDLWEATFGPEWREAQTDFPYFELCVLRKVYTAVMDGTGEGVDYAVDQLFPREIAHVTRPMLKTMWKSYRV